MKLNIELLIVCVFTLGGCKDVEDNGRAIKVKTVPKDGIVINKWQMLGPFFYEDENKSIDSNHIACFGFKEADMTFDDLLTFYKDSIENSCQLSSIYKNDFIFTGDTPFEFKKILTDSDNKATGSYYLGCLIKCNDTVSTRLHFSTNTNAKVWFNNELFLKSDYRLPMKAYREFKPIKLKKGDNFLLVKIQDPKEGTEVYARLENENKRALNRFYGLRNQSILEGSILLYGDTVKLSSMFPPSKGVIKIYDNENNEIISDSIHEEVKWSWPLSAFQKGDYLVKASIGDIEVIQDIYRGDIIDTIQKVFNELKHFNVSKKTKRHIDALNFRFRHLQENTWWGDYKYLDIFKQIKHIYGKIGKREDPFNHNAGFFLRSYMSEIDASEQFYILHVPSSYKKEKAMPISAIVPINLSGNKPYLESFRIANIELSYFFQDLAEKYNMIILEYGARRNEKGNHNSIEETELFLIFDDIEKDYSIDRSKISLAGTCSAGNELIKLAIKYPDIFASVGIISPDIIYVAEDANPWVNSNFPIRYLGNIKNLPILNMHSVIDRHVPIEASENLDKLTKHFDLKNFNYVKVANEYPKYGVDYFFSDLMEFNKNYKLNKRPATIDFTTSQMLYNKSFWITITDMEIPGEAHIQANISKNKLVVEKKNITAYSIDIETLPFNSEKPLKIIDNDEVVFDGIVKDSVIHINPNNSSVIFKKNSNVAGPLAHVFVHRFVLVKGTIGSALENKAIEDMANRFNESWQERYFVNCIIKDDIAVTEADMETSHIVLLGNPNSNLLFKKLNKELPLMISDNKIILKGKEVQGDKLGVYMVYPNPLNPNKYVVVIGFNNPGFASLGSETSGVFEDVSNYGWYDYKVWDNQTSRVIEKGYFNSSWE